MRGYLDNLFNRLQDGISLRRIWLIWLTWLSFVGCCYAAPLVISAAPSPLKTSIVEKPDYLQREAADEKLLEQRRHELLEHISGARDIRVAKSETAFSWKIRWREQQRYCKKIESEIFTKKAITFPEPVYTSTRGTSRQLRNTLDRAISPRKCGNLLAKISAQISIENRDELVGAKAGIGEWGGYSFRIYVTRTRMQTDFIVEYLMPGINI